MAATSHQDHELIPALGRERSNTHIRNVYISIMALLIGGFLLFAASSWDQNRKALLAELQNTNHLLRQTVETMFVHHESILRVLGQRMLQFDALMWPERGRDLVEQMVRMNVEFAGFGVARPDGQLVLVSGIKPEARLPNLLEREDSRRGFQEALASDQMVIGRTYFFPLLQQWLIPIRLALRDDSGNVRIVMTAGIRLDSPAAIWNAVEFNPRMRVALQRADGLNQLVLPLDPGRSGDTYRLTSGETHSKVERMLMLLLPQASGLRLTEAMQRYPLTVVSRYGFGHVMFAYMTRTAMPAGVFVVMLLGVTLIFLYLQRRHRAHESELIRQATHDALTGLPNRVVIEDRVQQDIARAKRHRHHIAVMYLDLDQFKRVNDTLGHRAGDALLQACSQRLQISLREGDTVGRLGGDEFLLIFPDLHEEATAASLAARVMSVFEAPFLLDGQRMFSTASIGVALYPKDGEDAEALLKNADTALYRAKDDGRNSFCFFQPEQNAMTTRRIVVETALRSALERDELYVEYQPKSSAANLAWEGAEALVRWNSKELGIVSPAEFIPIAEETGLIDDIGSFVIAKALRDLHWMRAIIPDFKMAINVSVRQFRNSAFIPQLLDQLASSGLPPDHVELEVTESIMAESLPQLEILREAGLRLAIDDFGTGFSCLSYLKRLPVTTLKLDREFVRDLESDHADKALVTAMIAVARELDLDTVAEGVETEGQLSFLQAQQCTQLQGFLLGKPKRVRVFLEELASQRGQSPVAHGVA